MRKALFAAVIICIIAAAGLYGALATGKNSGWAHPEVMATIDEVKHAMTHLEKYVIIDASKKKPDKTVKGAIWASFKVFRQKNGLLKGIWGYPIKPGQFDPEELQHIFRQLGVDEDKTVIVLARDPTDAMVVWYALYFLGFDKAKVLPVNYTVIGERYLTGSFKTYDPSWPETGKFTVDRSKIRWYMYATRDDILNAIENPSIGIADLRPPAYYNGSKAKTIRGGHIMTAVNIPYYMFWKDKYLKELKDPEEIRSMISEKFPEQVKKIITTCNTGHKASAGYLIWQVGYDWALDDASWNFHAFEGDMPASDVTIINLFACCPS